MWTSDLLRLWAWLLRFFLSSLRALAQGGVLGWQAFCKPVVWARAMHTNELTISGSEEKLLLEQLHQQNLHGMPLLTFRTTCPFS